LREDLAVLVLDVANLAGELEKIYINYLKCLTESVAMQLILASYQICTQKYPEYFLNLSLTRRSELQQKLKDLSLIFNRQLNNYLLKINHQYLDIIKKLPRILVNQESNLPASQINQDNLGQITTSLEKVNNQKEISPDELINSYLFVENSIHKTLNDLSRAANNYLQESGILPKKLPPKLWEMALQAEERGSVMSGSPNLLNLLIEREDEQEDEQRDTTSITAICLRLSEIEFSDPILSSYRNQIRNILARMEKFREEYRQKQREYAIAEAESAWRSSWFD
jgi:hypothetical protein